MSARTLALVLLAVACTACKRHDRKVDAEYVSIVETERDTAPRLLPGPMKPSAEERASRGMPIENPYAGDAKAIQEGRRLYQWMNCNGCHAEGGGSIGPALWDDQWRYGGRGVDIVESILHGRPNGMPAFAGHLPEEEAWKITAYVQSLEPRGGPFKAGVK